jgi:hypothetical protein
MVLGERNKNIELDKLTYQTNIMREIKSRRLAWLRHVERKETLVSRELPIGHGLRIW